MGHFITIHICNNTIFVVILSCCKPIGVGGTTFAHIYLQVANKRLKLTTYFKKKEVKTMIIGYLTGIPVSLAFILWLLHRYAVRRAKYLVSMELESLYDNVAEDEKMIEAVPIHQSVTPTWVSCRVT